MVRHPWRRKVGQRIRYYRRKKGLTLEKAAELYGTARTNWSRFEAGQNISLDTLVKMGKLLGIPARRLLKDI